MGSNRRRARKQPRSTAETANQGSHSAEGRGGAAIFSYGLLKGLDRLAAAGGVNYSLSNLDVLAEVAAEEG